MTAIGSSPGSPIGAMRTVTLSDGGGGIVFVPASAPLIGLNYYDGRFLRADDLNLERQGQRAYAEYSNQAGGPGLVYGFDLTQKQGTRLSLSAGLAVDPKGRLLYLPDQVEAAIADLITASQPASGATAPAAATSPAGFGLCEQASAGAATAVVGGTELYLVCVSRAQGLCGQSEVFGRICDDACVTATDRPYVVDGVALSLLPLKLLHQLPTLPGVTRPEVHLRSQVASAFFAEERDQGGSLLSASGLRTPVWCAGAASAGAGDSVPVGVLGWDGKAVTFLDEWTARRERMEPPPRSYWSGRLELRPWPVFFAQVLQFQCQLAGLGPITAGTAAAYGPSVDPYAPAKQLLDESRELMDELADAVATLSSAGGAAEDQRLAEAVQRYENLKERIRAAAAAPPPTAPASSRILLDGGIVELPPAGYLPVDVTSGLVLRGQLQGLLGDGVDLRLCAVRRDQIARELERAQHMSRISLIRGLRNRADRELVDILVPDGVLEADTTARSDYGFAVDLTVGPDASSMTPVTEAAAGLDRLLMRGVGRVDLQGGLTVRAAVAGSAHALSDMAGLIGRLARSEAGLGGTLGELHQLGFGSDVPAAGLLRDVGNLVVNRGIAQRTEGPPGGVVDVPDASGEVAAVSVSGWVSEDPFALADGAYAAFHLGFAQVAVSGGTISATYCADGRLQRLSGQPWDAGYQVRISVKGFAQASVTGGGTADSPSGSFTQTMVLRRGQHSGKSTLGLSDDRMTWMIDLGWHGDPVQATGALIQITAAGGKELTADAAIADAFALALGGIGRRPSSAPAGQDVIAAFDAAEDAAINQPGDPHREAAIAALQILSGSYPHDATYVERGYGELFPPAAALPSRVRPTTDWVLFRRRRREDCAGTVELTQPGTSKIAAWVARAESIDQAKSWAAELFGTGGTDIQWQAAQAANGDFLEFEANAATLLTTPSAWRERYQVANGGSVVFCAGYASAPWSSDVPVGVGRAQALVDACAPQATPDPQGQVDLVSSPPATGMLAGTDGSIFLITYQSY